MVMLDPAHFLPIVYDPIVGKAWLKFGYVHRRPRGMYVSIEPKDTVN
jgi:malate dehydrogenase (oxaloacetate-decarboxylating)(NADP+)